MFLSRARAIYTLSAQFRTIVMFLMGFYMGTNNIVAAVITLVVYCVLDFADSILYWRAFDERPIQQTVPV